MSCGKSRTQRAALALTPARFEMTDVMPRALRSGYIDAAWLIWPSENAPLHAYRQDAQRPDRHDMKATYRSPMTSKRTISTSGVPDRETSAIEAMTRRSALARGILLPLSAAFPATLVACSKTLHCDDTSALSADDLKTRNEIAAYVDLQQDTTKRCADCMQFSSAGEKACGSCKVVKGPINPDGGCKLFVPKKT
jgi:hypothetical protein